MSPAAFCDEFTTVSKRNASWRRLSADETSLGVSSSRVSNVLPSARCWLLLEGVSKPLTGTSDLCFQSATKLAQLIAAKTVSSEEVVTAYLARIAQVNPAINAVVTLCGERALEEARRADKELQQGICRGPWHGVPMTIKDSLDTAGVKSTAGTEGRKDFVPQDDATVVARLRKSGAILLGKTNTPELTMDYRTDNLLFGSTKNPVQHGQDSRGQQRRSGGHCGSRWLPLRHWQ